jgi:hypothetical protein
MTDSSDRKRDFPVGTAVTIVAFDYVVFDSDDAEEAVYNGRKGVVTHNYEQLPYVRVKFEGEDPDPEPAKSFGTAGTILCLPEELELLNE